MDALADVASTLDHAVDDGRLAGYVCGVRGAGRPQVTAGGSRSIGGAEMVGDAVFPLSSNTKPLGGALGDTAPAVRPVTLRHLLTMTAGFGWVEKNPALAEPMAEREIAPGPYAPTLDPATYLRRLAEPPLAGQPGDGWWYHTSSDVPGIGSFWPGQRAGAWRRC